MTAPEIPVFRGSFTQQEPISETAIEQAVAVMRTGRLHRYNVAEGETSQTNLLETEFAESLGMSYCLACASGGYALHVALKALGIQPGQKVLTNAFTLSPVPGAIHNAGGSPVLVETTESLVLDLVDLERKILASGAKVLMLSHMRGHLVDMDALMQVLSDHDVALVEDCAHTMGASWNGKASGTYGIVSCFSTQTYKHINSGEGGLLVSNDEALMARATLMSGSYMLYANHDAAPDESFFDSHKYETPNYSGRMDNLRAAILRPQLSALSENVDRWNKRYRVLENALAGVNNLHVPPRPDKELFVGSSLQFLVEDLDNSDAQTFVDTCAQHGVSIKWFGAPEPHGYTSRFDSWHYLDAGDLPRSKQILSELFDIRIPLSISVSDYELIGNIIAASLRSVRHRT
ncbi:MAG: DegT/DnrJ/EryC1/StrS family aminotransferase [Gammaproteobacteria bacterium]|nr:DegT/DnrJ/EryC1/StrS family aminotransferase [Gammaproteobacteria bacterium]